MKINSLFIVSLAFLINGCDIETTIVGDGAELEPGPNGSWFVGGADGGVYINVHEDHNPNDSLYQGVIYDDFTKEVWYRGGLKYIGDIEFSPENKSQYRLFDGDLLYLKNGTYLEPTDPFPVEEQRPELDLVAPNG